MEELTEIYNKIYRYCFYRIRNSAVAQDITQESFLKYFSRNIRLKSGDDMAYLYTIAKNLCMDYFRKRHVEGLAEKYSTEDFSEESDTKIAVRAAMEELDKKHGETLLLRYIVGLTVNETAKVMGISRFAVHRLERAALAEMKKILEGAI